MLKDSKLLKTNHHAKENKRVTDIPSKNNHLELQEPHKKKLKN